MILDHTLQIGRGMYIDQGCGRAKLICKHKLEQARSLFGPWTPLRTGRRSQHRYVRSVCQRRDFITTVTPASRVGHEYEVDWG